MKKRSIWFYYMFILTLLHLCVYGEDIMDRSDFNLKIEFFSADSKLDQLKELKEKKLISYHLDFDKAKGNNASEGVLNFFENRIDKLEQFATYTTNLNSKEIEQTRWMRHGFLIDISIPENLETKESCGFFVNVGLFNLIDNFKIKQKIEIVENKLTIAATKNKDIILILLFQVKKIEKQYRSIFYFDNFVISTMKGKWNDGDFSKQEMIFPESKAELKKGDKGMVLFAGNIIYDKTKNILIGEKAKVFDCNGKKLFEGNKIIVPINHPDDIKVLE